MNQKLRKTSLFFLWISITIIIFHGIIPHHHHLDWEDEQDGCYLHADENKAFDHNKKSSSFLHHENEENKDCDECHFRINYTQQIEKIKIHIQAVNTYNPNFVFKQSAQKCHFETSEILADLKNSSFPDYRAPPLFV